MERHYSVQDVAGMWGLSDETIRRLFRDEKGVLKIGSPETRFKRKRIQLSIPESVLVRVYQRLSNRAMKNSVDVHRKVEIYRKLYELNAAFAVIVGHCDALQQAGVLTPKYKRLFQGFTQEVQAELNHQILEAIDSVELADWGRFGRVREKWEKYLRGPEPKRKKS